MQFHRAQKLPRILYKNPSFGSNMVKTLFFQMKTPILSSILNSLKNLSDIISVHANGLAKICILRSAFNKRLKHRFSGDNYETFSIFKLKCLWQMGEILSFYLFWYGTCPILWRILLCMIKSGIVIPKVGKNTYSGRLICNFQYLSSELSPNDDQSFKLILAPVWEMRFFKEGRFFAFAKSLFVDIRIARQ